MIKSLGLFDSGVGGFTVLKSVLDLYPELSCVYLGDTARIPYGSRYPSEIREIAKELVQWLGQQDLSAVLVACNTTNSLALDLIENGLGIPVLGLIQSAVEMINDEKRIGVLATPSTVTSKAYTKALKRLNPNSFVLEQACPAFVPLIEMGRVSFDSIGKLAIDYLSPLLQAKVEAIVLGCSHYPLLAKILKELLPSNVRLIDPAIGLANKLENLLGPFEPSIESPRNYANTRFCVTSDPSGFALKASHWLGIRPEVELVSLHEKACFF